MPNKDVVKVMHEEGQLDRKVIFHSGPDGYKVTKKSPYPEPTP